MYTLTQPWTTLTYLSQKVTNILTKSQAQLLQQDGENGSVDREMAVWLTLHLPWQEIKVNVWIEKYKELKNTEVHTKKTLLKCSGKGIRSTKLHDSAIYKLDKPHFVYTFFLKKQAECWWDNGGKHFLEGRMKRPTVGKCEIKIKCHKDECRCVCTGGRQRTQERGGNWEGTEGRRSSEAKDIDREPGKRHSEGR